MAFHYQNLLQEKDLQYDNFEEQYQQILRYTNSRLSRYYHTHRHVTRKGLQELVVTSVRTHGTFQQETFTFDKRQEKILIVNNILFQHSEGFLRHLFDDKTTTLEACYRLKDVLNELDRKDKDFLDGTMEGLVRYHLPSFDRIKMEFNIWAYDEFIVWKLMELLYVSPEMVKENYEKIKKRI